MFKHSSQEILLIEVPKNKNSAKLIMQWRNDPLTLEMFYHREPKVWPDFWTEFQSSYFEVPNSLTPLFATFNGEKVAFLRFGMLASQENAQDLSCDISINLAPKFRGQGLAVPILEATSTVLKNNGISQIIAEIRSNNFRSISSFEKAGYTELEKTTKLIVDTQEIVEISVLVKQLS